MRKKNKLNRHKKTWKLILTFVLFVGSSASIAQKTIHCDYEITAETVAITDLTFQPGDTLCLMGGVRGPLYLKNIIGTDENPIVIINKNGQSIIDSDLTYGLRFAYSEHIVISGAGDQPEKYGIHIREVTNGYGLDIGALSTNFEVEYLEIEQVTVAGIVAKTDPNCIYPADRPNFTMYNIKIHDNYIHHIGTEGMYIGSSFFLGHHISSCDTTLFPHIIDGVEIYNNRIEYTGWDGIQVGSALYNCSIHDNTIYKDSQAEISYQMSGIIVNPGSSCNVYNNKIIDGKGTGILNQGTGGQKFFNNLIINVGMDYAPEDQTLKQQFGIFSKDTYIHPPDSSFHFYNNTIINPKSDGIRFANSHSENNRFINNIIINPGTYEYYANLGSVDFEPQDAYINNYLDCAEIQLLNNILERSSKDQFFADSLNLDFHLSINSPAANTGYNLSSNGITFDIENYPRPFENYFDIGAYELQTLTPVYSLSKPNAQLQISPNPASTFLNLEFYLDKAQQLDIKCINIEGKEFPLFYTNSFTQGINKKKLSVAHLPIAEYIILIYNNKVQLVQKFQKF